MQLRMLRNPRIIRIAGKKDYIPCKNTSPSGFHPADSWT
jgi:hypothetical protein